MWSNDTPLREIPPSYRSLFSWHPTTEGRGTASSLINHFEVLKDHQDQDLPNQVTTSPNGSNHRGPSPEYVPPADTGVVQSLPARVTPTMTSF
jgi:hypothetical protein